MNCDTKTVVIGVVALLAVVLVVAYFFMGAQPSEEPPLEPVPEEGAGITEEELSELEESLGAMDIEEYPEEDLTPEEEF
jgi:high-affinity Fe2+/Pb2+ permease